MRRVQSVSRYQILQKRLSLWEFQNPFLFPREEREMGFGKTVPFAQGRLTQRAFFPVSFVLTLIKYCAIIF